MRPFNCGLIQKIKGFWLILRHFLFRHTALLTFSLGFLNLLTLGCYVLKTDVPKEMSPKEEIHERYSGSSS
jgi:hypothetical protein